MLLCTRCLAAVFLISAPWLFSAAPPTKTAEAPDEPALKLDPYSVTGSRLRRTENEGPTPLFRVELSEITQAGFARPEDYLRQLPFLVGSSQDTTSPTTFQPGITSMNLRGLGYASGLPLVNGRRVAPFGQAGAAQLGYDMGSIPYAALRSIEIAKDGASAVYGSDAVAGVINYQLRTDFVGTEISASYRQMEDSDWGYWRASVLHGFSTARGHVVFALEHDDNNSVLFSDRPISQSEDFRAIGGFDLRAPYTFPAHLVVPVGTPGVPAALTGRLIAPGQAFADGTIRLGATTTPTVAGFVALPSPVVNGVYIAGDTRNGLDRAPYSTMNPVLHNTGAWLYAEFAATPRLTAFLDASYRHRIVGTTYEPSTISLVGEAGFGDLPGGGIVFPTANPYNPFGVAITDMTFYLPAMEARDNQMTVDVPRFVAGLRGQLDHDWEWEAAATYSRNTVHSHWHKFLSDQALQDGLAGRLGGWLNPFGPSDPGVIEKLWTDLHDLQYAQLTMGDTQARGPLFAGWGGRVQSAIGAEWREDRFVHKPDLLRSNGGLVSLARRPYRNLRKITSAIYAELSIPLTTRAELTAAVRWEHYRDFGDPVKPKFGARWQVLKDLTLRATYSEAFRTPELLQAYTDAQETFIQTRDPLRPDLGIYTMRVRNGGNPRLKPETTTVTYAGFIYEPSWLKGFEFVTDFWEYRQTNLISTLGADNILRNEATVAAGRIERGPAPGPGVAGEVIAINDTFGNFNRYSTNGVDFELRYRRTVGANRFSAGVTAVRLYSAKRQNVGFNATESVNTLTFANWRLNTDLTWRRGPYDANLFINWIGEQTGSAPAAGLPAGQSALAVTNLTFGFPGPGKTEWRLGANNLLDVDPPRNYNNRTGYLNGYYDAQGRTWLIEVRRRF